MQSELFNPTLVVHTYSMILLLILLVGIRRISLTISGFMPFCPKKSTHEHNAHEHMPRLQQKNTAIQAKQV